MFMTSGSVRPIVRSLCALLAIVLQQGDLYAQGPGFPNVPQVAGAHLAGPLIPLQGRTAVVIYENGVFITNIETASSPGGSDYRSRAWNLSDLSNIRSQEIADMRPNSAVSAHGYWQEGPYIRGLNGSGGDFIVTGQGDAATARNHGNRPAPGAGVAGGCRR